MWTPLCVVLIGLDEDEGTYLWYVRRLGPLPYCLLVVYAICLDVNTSLNHKDDMNLTAHRKRDEVVLSRDITDEQLSLKVK